MIQRIQTLFFLGVVLISVLLIFVPVYELPDIQVPPNPDGTPAIKAISIANNALLMLLNGAVGVFALVAIFLYRNRNLQARIGNLMLLLLCIEVGLLFSWPIRWQPTWINGSITVMVVISRWCRCSLPFWRFALSSAMRP